MTNQTPSAEPTNAGLVREAVAWLYASDDGSRELILDCNGEHARRLIELGWTEQPLFARPTQADDVLLTAAIGLRDDLLDRARWDGDTKVVVAGNGAWFRFNDAIDAALKASPTTEPKPEGMKVGERQPTEAMLNAARDWSYGKYGKPIGNEAAIGCWQAMFDAAPSDPTP